MEDKLFLNNNCSEERKENFRQYLQEHGVIAKITDIFNKMIASKQKPEDAIEFLQTELGAKVIPQETIEDMEYQLDEAYRKINNLRRKIEDLGLGGKLKEMDKYKSSYYESEL